MVVLQEVHTVEYITKGTFDGRNWDKVKYLKISNTPQSKMRRGGIDRNSRNSYSNMKVYPTSKKNIMNNTNWISTTTAVKPVHKFPLNLRYTHRQLMEISIKSIEPYAMENLKSLEEFYIESSFFTDLDYGSFAGLDKLKVLSFKTCENLRLKSVIKAINGSETVSNLQTLSMFYINVGIGVEVGKEFFTALSTKALQTFEMQEILVANVEIKYLHGTVMKKSLKIINFSGITLNQVNGMGTLTFTQPQLLNISSATLPMIMFRFIKFLPLSNLTFPFDIQNTSVLTNFQSLDYSNIYKYSKPIEFYNVTILILHTKHNEWKIKHLIARQNNMKYLDVTIPCVHSSFETISLADNGITFLRPDICPCCFNLKKLDLSYNKLNEMSKMNFSLFSQIFNFYPSLTEIYLTSNELTRIPEAVFIKNKRLEIIDLSHNSLEQVRFRLLQLKNLKSLNLQYNKIAVLDITSLNNLKLFKQNISGVFDFRHNPILCSKCDTLQSIHWLVTSQLIVHSKQDFVCVENAGTDIPVDNKALTAVQKLCDRPKYILLGTLVPVVSIISIIVILRNIQKFRRHKQHIIDMAEKVRLIQEDAMDTEFVVYLCFSSDDDEFISTYVYEPLNQNLKNIIGTNRDLVAYGDKEFIPGQSRFNEMVRCLEQSSVMILLLSPNFCKDGFCRIALDQALIMDKPIILMLNGEADETKMDPSLRNIFRKNTCIWWEKQEDEYKLKTSWENVCTSVLELV